MSDKMRGALFNMLGDINGLTVLDAFTGSGALSFEAISRGAVSSVAVDIDKGAITTVVNSISDLGLNKQIKAIRAGATSWSETNEKAQFDLVLCDPPYDKLQLTTLQNLVKHVKSDGTFVLSWPGKMTPPEFVGFEQLADKQYGDSQLIFYRKVV